MELLYKHTVLSIVFSVVEMFLERGIDLIIYFSFDLFFTGRLGPQGVLFTVGVFLLGLPLRLVGSFEGLELVNGVIGAT